MKKAMMAIVIVMAVRNVSGQSLTQGIFNRLSFGVRAGGNYSNFTNASFGTSGLAGFHAGLLVAFRLNRHLSVEEDFLFSTQGAKLKDDIFHELKDLKLSYVAVPIVLKYRTMTGIYFEAGAQTSMLVSDVKNTQFKDFANKVDIEAVGGLGYQVKLGGTKSLGIGVRYCQGLTKVGKFTSTSLSPEFKNSLAQLSVFYIF